MAKAPSEPNFENLAHEMAVENVLQPRKETRAERRRREREEKKQPSKKS